MEEQQSRVPDGMAPAASFRVNAKIGGYVVTMPDPQSSGAIKEFVCTSLGEVSHKLAAWGEWLERDDEAISDIEAHMTKGT